MSFLLIVPAVSFFSLTFRYDQQFFVFCYGIPYQNLAINKRRQQCQHHHHYKRPRSDFCSFCSLGCQTANYPSRRLQTSRKLNSAVPLCCLSQRAVFYGTFLSAILTRSISSPIVLSYKLMSIKKEKEQPLPQFVLSLNQACQSGLCRVMP